MARARSALWRRGMFGDNDERGILADAADDVRCEA